MNAPLEMTEHLTENELAALVEHGVEGADRRVVEHVAGCGECSEVLMMASDVQQELRQEPETAENVTHAEFGDGGRAWWKVAASAAALAVALFVVFGENLREKWFGPKGTEALAEASRTVELRATDGRLSGFPYQERRVTRSADPENDDLSYLRVDAAAAKILREPEADPHATGVAYLLLRGGQGRPFAGVSDYFEKALAQAKPEERRAIVNDYAVALIDSGSDADLAKALSLLEQEWRRERTPEIAYNRALVLEHLRRDKEALAAWNDYLQLDSDSQWAADARKRRDVLLELNPELRRP